MRKGDCRANDKAGLNDTFDCPPTPFLLIRSSSGLFCFCLCMPANSSKDWSKCWQRRVEISYVASLHSVSFWCLKVVSLCCVLDTNCSEFYFHEDLFYMQNVLFQESTSLSSLSLLTDQIRLQSVFASFYACLPNSSKDWKNVDRRVAVSYVVSQHSVSF